MFSRQYHVPWISLWSIRNIHWLLSNNLRPLGEIFNWIWCKRAKLQSFLFYFTNFQSVAPSIFRIDNFRRVLSDPLKVIESVHSLPHIWQLPVWQIWLFCCKIWLYLVVTAWVTQSVDISKLLSTTQSVFLQNIYF